MTTWDMYWFTRLDYLQGLGVLMALLLGIGLVFWVITCSIEGGASFGKHGWKVILLWLFFLCLSLFTPTQKEAAAIWLVPKMVNNEQLNNIATNTIGILEEQTKQYLGELVGEKETE